MNCMTMTCCLNDERRRLPGARARRALPRRVDEHVAELVYAALPPPFWVVALQLWARVGVKIRSGVNNTMQSKS